MIKNGIIYVSMIAFFMLNNIAVTGQAELMLNGGYVVLNGGVKATPIYLVVANSSTSAIQNLKAGTAKAEGGIISESEFNQVLWNVGNASSGTYTVPFCNTSTYGFYYIPLSFTINAAGTPHSTGGIALATYGGESFASEYLNSSYMPTTVANMDNLYTGANNSDYVVDRFWIIDALNYTNPNYYTTNPGLSGITFTYLDGTVLQNTYTETSAVGDLLNESNLVPQRWNSTSSKWGDWIGTATVNKNTPYNYVGQAVGGAVTSANFFRVWTLADNLHPLPIQLLTFTAECSNYSAELKWTTATESNNDYFTVEKTQDGINYELVGTIKGAGTTTQEKNYTLVDDNPFNGISYYRLKQTDFDGTTVVAGEVVYTACENASSINAYSYQNTVNIQINETSAASYEVFLINSIGQVVLGQTYNTNVGLNLFKLYPQVAQGVYFIRINGSNKVYTQKVLIN